MLSNSIGNRVDRKARSTNEEEEIRKPRKFCDGGGVFCTIYRAIQGDSNTNSPHQMAERREELNAPRYLLHNGYFNTISFVFLIFSLFYYLLTSSKFYH